ncbi:MAG: hypothetical protein U1E46_15090 [Hyphomicrobiales bacterium]
MTGFEPYGGRPFNPAYDVMRALDGSSIAGRRVIGRALPVVLHPLAAEIARLIEEFRPAGIIALGLYPGEPMLRLERIGINVTDFDIPDNSGAVVRDEPLREDAAAGLFATLPLRSIETRLLAEGIPAKLSTTAGAYLCNACLYTLLHELDRQRLPVPAGFIHVPYTPEQVAALIVEGRCSAASDMQKRTELPSMELARMVRGVEIAIETTVRETVTA